MQSYKHIDIETRTKAQHTASSTAAEDETTAKATEKEGTGARATTATGAVKEQWTAGKKVFNVFACIWRLFGGKILGVFWV